MPKAKGSVLISIGSILMIIASILGIIGGILLAFASGWLVSTFSIISDGLMDMDMPGAEWTTFLLWGGAFVGIIVLVFSVLYLIFGIMAFKRRSDLRRSTFPLVIGIIFTALALLSFLQGINVATAYGLAAPLLILIGAILNRGQLKSMPAYPPGYPQGQAPYPPYQDPGQGVHPPQAYPPQAYPPQPGQEQPPSNPPPTP